MKDITARFGIGPVHWGVAAIVIAAFLLRCVGVTSRWFWLDELLTVNWSVHGPWAALVNVLRFDLHPPLYYLQLSLWALLGDSDVWLMANTILWSTAAVAFLVYSVSRIYGWRAGLYSGALLALSPAALAYADDVRMYSFIVFLVIWVWYAQERWLVGAAGRFGALWMIVSQVAVVYSHSAGLVMLSGSVIYGAVRVLAAGQRQTILRWLAIECAVGALALPAVLIALMRGATHTRTPDLTALLQTWTYITFGDMGSAWAVALGALLFATLFILAFYDKRMRLPLATQVFMPFIVAAVVSYAFKPMWLPRVFLPTLPFICLILGVGTAMLDKHLHAPAVLRTRVFLLLVAVWAGVGLFQQFNRAKGDGFKPAAELVHTIAKPGDVVLIDGDYEYWCFNWYFAGPAWGEPRHAFILNDDWARMMKRLPLSAASLLDLNQSDSSLLSGGVTVMLWNRNSPIPESTGDLIVVRPQTSTEPTFPGRRLTSSAHLQQLLVESYTK